ncbi:MAG TPA: SdrD B-like domain-containing protein [Fimbriiglobus sp.]|nr:SdrD B-like domain-containing protein [Fimbriiglobus sp.]
MRANRPTLLQLEDRTAPATLSGTVFADVNANGIQDASEPGLPNVAVQVDAFGDGIPDFAATTDAGGRFAVAGLPDGAHTLHVTAPAGSTPVSPTTQTLIVAGGTDVSTIVGVKPGGGVTGTVYADLNGNGVRDAGEPGAGGVAVTLDTFADTSPNATVLTLADGSYAFASVPDGTHVVGVTPPVNYFPSGPNARHAGIAAGSTATGIDFALRPASAIGGKVLFADISPGRPGIAGLTVQLDLNNDDIVDASTVTDKTGAYLFTNVPNGLHAVRVAAPAGAVFNVPANVNQLVTIVNGDIKGGLNFGVLLPGAVTGGLFLDLDRDGQRDPGERSLIPARVQVDLYNSGALVNVGAQMRADGTFISGGLPDGTHALIVTPTVGYASAAPIRSTFTVTGGSTASTPAGAVESMAGSTLAIGHGMTGNVQTFTFAPGPDGSLQTVPGRTTNTPARTSARVVAADFNGDGVDDTITATGPGEPNLIRVYDGATGAELVPGGIAVFERTFAGGLNLAAGDFNRDGKADIVVSADTGGGPRVQVLDAAQFQAGADPARGLVLADFLGIEDAHFRGGTRVAVGDVNGDKMPDIVVAAGQGGGPRVAIFDGRSIAPTATPFRVVGDFFVFESRLRNGATVAVGDVDGDGLADLVAGAGPGGAPRVAVFGGSGIAAGEGIGSPRVVDFFVTGDTSSRKGTRVAVKDLDRDGLADVIATVSSRAYVYTAAGIRAFHQSPLPGMTGPGTSAGLVPFGDGAGGVFVG